MTTADFRQSTAFASLALVLSAAFLALNVYCLRKMGTIANQPPDVRGLIALPIALIAMPGGVISLLMGILVSQNKTKWISIALAITNICIAGRAMTGGS